MRGRMDDRKSYANRVPLGGVMDGESVATVIASKHPGYSEGDILLARITAGEKPTMLGGST
jgi:NADPH-dependent curcumin reductase CurA